MKRLSSWLGVVVFGAAVLLPASLRASHFVFTNNDIAGANSVTTFAVDSATGALTKIGTTPTGGTGCGPGGFYASTQIVTSPNGNYLYVANKGSNNITTFQVNTTTGALTAVGSPVATGSGVVGCTAGISLAILPDGDFLYAATPGGTAATSNIRIFHVSSNGALSPIGGLVSLPSYPDGITVRGDGSFLAVALVDAHEVAIFNSKLGFLLLRVPGSPFAAGGEVAGVDFNSAGGLLFGGQATETDTIVSVFGVGTTGALSPVTGSPFTFGLGTDNSNVVLSNGNLLFVSDQTSGSLIDFIVGNNGALTLGASQPVFLGDTRPVGLAVVNENSMIRLYVAEEYGSQVFAFTVAANGTLTPVPGSPFPTGEEAFSGLHSLAAE